MAVAYWMYHAPQSTFPSVNQGEPAILFCFIFLLIAAAGPGPWSIDASRKRQVVVIEDAGEPVP
jgi:putative oxidoreductase